MNVTLPPEVEPMLHEYHLGEYLYERPGLRRAWIECLGRYLVDPGSIPVPSTVTYDDQTRTLAWPEYVYDAEGWMQVADSITGEVIPQGSFGRAGDGEMVPVLATRSLRLDEHPAFPRGAARSDP